MYVAGMLNVLHPGWTLKAGRLRDDPWTENRNPDARFENDGWNPDHLVESDGWTPEDCWIDFGSAVSPATKDPLAVSCSGGGGG